MFRRRPPSSKETSPPELFFIVFDRAGEQGRVRWTGSRLVIGRRVDTDIWVNEPTMSGLHAEIVPTPEGLMIRDLDSLNGTQLNGVKTAESLLRSGDEIRIGRARILVSSSSSAEVKLPADDPTKDFDEELDSQEPAARDKRFQATDSQTGQTVRVRLEDLRASDAEEIEEDGRTSLLLELFEALRGVEDPSDILGQTQKVLGQAFTRARVFILRRHQEVWKDPGVIDLGRPLSMTIVEETAASKSAILSTSLPEDHRFQASESARISGIETAMAAPTSCAGETVAILYVDRLGLPPFNVQDLNILGIAANHVSAVLENASRIDELRTTNSELVRARENLAELNRNLECLVEERTAEIRRQAEEIQTLAAAKDELLGMAAHDIRGPLTVIQGTVELLRLRAERFDRATLVDSLDMVYGAARSLSQLLSELLDAKAIEAGSVSLDLRPTSVRTLFETALPVPRLAAEDKAISLHLEGDLEVATLADPQRLAQAITNLILNAIKFSQRGSKIVLRGVRPSGVRPSGVRPSGVRPPGVRPPGVLGAAGGRIQLIVEDQGVGIPEEDLERIFGTFEQGIAGKRLGGSGLGLMIARRLVELHGGELTVESEVGVGSRFTLDLPALNGDDAEESSS
ncbi:MAG: ATP-binding protein [Acidobacteriota bacterium]